MPEFNNWFHCGLREDPGNPDICGRVCKPVSNFVEYLNGKDVNFGNRFSDIEFDQRQLWHYGQEGESRGPTYEDFNRYYAAKHGFPEPAPKTVDQRALKALEDQRPFREGRKIPEETAAAKDIQTQRHT